MAVVDGFDVDMGTVGEALRLRELVDLAYDGLAKLLQGEFKRDDAAAEAAACERRVVGDGAHSDPWATRLPSNARPAAVARTCKRGHRWIHLNAISAATLGKLWHQKSIKNHRASIWSTRFSSSEQSSFASADSEQSGFAARRPTANRPPSRPVPSVTG